MKGEQESRANTARATDLDLFEAAPCGYVVTDDAGLIVRANAEFLRIVGRDADDVMSRRTLVSLVTVGTRIFFETHLLPMLQHDGIVREVELDLVRADGRPTPVLFNANPIGTPGSRAIRGVIIEAMHRHRYEDNLRQATHVAEQAREKAAATAETLQQTLIPPAPPKIPDLEIAAAYRPAGEAREVGGDFYDVFQVAPASWCIVLGDVSGKGISAATVTSQVRYTVRSLAIEHPDPAELFEHLDRTLRKNPTEHYCTLVLVRLDRENGRWLLNMSLAGHPPPLVRHGDGTVTELGIPGTPVGLLDDPQFHTVALTLTDETLLLYTDGVTDARGAEGLFGVSRLANLLAGLPPDVATITESVAHHAVSYQHGDATDDIAIVTFAAAGPSHLLGSPTE